MGKGVLVLNNLRWDGIHLEFRRGQGTMGPYWQRLSISSFPGGLVSKESTCQCRRPGFDSWVGKIPWRRKWQPIPVFLVGKSHGERSLAGYRPWGHKESDMTEWLNHHHHAFDYGVGQDSRKSPGLQGDPTSQS